MRNAGFARPARTSVLAATTGASAAEPQRERVTGPAPAAYTAVLVLEVVAARGPITAAAIARHTDMAKSSVFDLLASLQLAGMVQRRGAGWCIGLKAFEIGQAIIRSNAAAAEFRRVTGLLPTLSGETVLFATREELDIVYLARHDGRKPVRVPTDSGDRRPAVVTALGKAMLSRMEIGERDKLLSSVGALPRITPNSHKSTEALGRDLMESRLRGYAVDHEQNTVGLSCVAVPIADRPFAVSTTMATSRFTPSFQERLVEELTMLARHLEPLTEES